MFCPNCGKKVDDNAVFCDNCGTRLKPAEPAQDADQTSQPLQNADQTPQPSENAGEAAQPSENAEETAQPAQDADQASQQTTDWSQSDASAVNAEAPASKSGFKPGTPLFKGIIGAVIALIVILIIVNIAGNAGGKGTAKKACKAIANVDVEALCKLIPDEILEEYDISDEDIEDLQDKIDEQIEDLEDNEDEKLKISYDIKRYRDVEDDVMEGIEDYYDSYDLNVQDARIARVEFTAKLGEEEDDTGVLDLYVVKIGGKWYLDTDYNEDLTYYSPIDFY